MPDCQHKFKLVVGAMPLQNYLGFLPGSRQLAELVAWVGEFTGLTLACAPVDEPVPTVGPTAESMNVELEHWESQEVGPQGTTASPLTPDEIWRHIVQAKRGFRATPKGAPPAKIAPDPKMIGQPLGLGFQTGAAIQIVDKARGTRRSIREQVLRVTATSTSPAFASPGRLETPSHDR